MACMYDTDSSPARVSWVGSQADVIHEKVLGCDQKVQKLSTDIILYTCNKLGYMRL
jgi:hypothetical protein